MVRLRKSSVLACLALMCQMATGCPNDRDSSSSSTFEGLQAEEGSRPSPEVHGDGRGRTDSFLVDRSAQRETAQKFTPNTSNPIRPARIFRRRSQMAMRNDGKSRLPQPGEPSFLADSSRVGTTYENSNRNVADGIPRFPESAGAFGSSVSTMISENVRPSRPINRRTQSQASDNNPSRPRFSVQNPFPIGVVQPNESNGSSPAVNFFYQSNHHSGLNIPVASGGVEPPNNYVPQDQLFVYENIGGFAPINPANTQHFQGSVNGEGSPNLFPSRNTNTNLGSTGSSNGGGSPSVIPFQNTNNNFGSSTGSFNGGSSHQPSTGSVGSPTNGFPSNNNFFQSSGSTNQFPSKNNDKFGGGQSYPEIFAVVNGIQELTLHLLATFRASSQNNVVYSPVSISSLLSLLTLATNGNSKREIEVALFPPTSSSSNDHHKQFETILERMNHLSQGITISTSSRLFLEQSVNISGTFTDGALKHYNCSVSLENFVRKPELTMNRVNGWVEKETFGKITQFVSQPFGSNTKFVAVNTIYFDGKWDTPFPESSTTERDFDTGNEVIKIPMMTNVIETLHYYSKELNVDVTSLPYSGGEFAMIIILPRESPREKTVVDLENQLDTTTIENLVNNLTSKTVSIALPKMKLAMKTSLVTNLSQLRIRSIFSPSTADFSSMSDTKPLWVSEFLHEAVMEVTEEGTVAAAASGVFLNRMGGQQTINVNKPAIIFIRDMVTRVPLFWTRLVKPERLPESEQKTATSPKKF